MDPKPLPHDDIHENRQPSPEIQENQPKSPALLDLNSIRSPDSDCEKRKKKSKTFQTFRSKLLELAQKSKMSPEQKLLIEQGFQDFSLDLHVPDHPPYAWMIQRAIRELDEAGGCSEEAISLFIKKDQNDLPWAHATLLTHHLEKLCEKGEVVVTDEKCYMLNTAGLAFNPNQSCSEINPVGPSRIPSYSTNSSPSSSSASDYRPNAKRRAGSRKYGKKHRGARKKSDSEEEFDDTEDENYEETEEEEEFEDTDEEYVDTEEEVEVTAVESQVIKYQKGKQTHGRGNVVKKNKTDEKSDRMRVVAVRNQVNTAYNGKTKPVRGRGRPPKISGPKTYIAPGDGQLELIEAHNKVAQDPNRLKQRRGRGRPSKNIGLKTETGPGETQKELLEAHNQTRGSCTPSKNIGTETTIGPKEVNKEVMKSFNQRTEDFNRPKEKRGRGRPPKNSGVKPNIGQKETQGEVSEAHNQVVNVLQRPKQKRGRGRPPKSSEGQMEVFEVHNQATEDGMKLKQGRRRRRCRRKCDSKEEVKQLNQLEVIVVQDMMERMVIQSCDEGDHVIGEVLPIVPYKSLEPVMEDEMKKDKREHQTTRSVGGVESSQKLKDMEKLSRTPVQMPQNSTEDEPYPCQLHSQAQRDEYTTNTKEMTSSQILHEKPQSECIGQGGPLKFEPVRVASLTVPNYKHEDGRQQQVQMGQERLLEPELETATFMELLHFEYQPNFHHQQLDQPKHQPCGMSTKPIHCTEEDDKYS